MFRGSSTQLYIPTFDTRRISNPLACPLRTPTKGTSTEDLGQSQLQGVPNSPSYNLNLLLEALQTNTTNSQSLTNTRIASQLEGYNPKHKAKKDWVTTWWSNTTTTKQSLFLPQKSYREDSRFSSSVEKTKGFETSNSKKIFGK